MQTKLVVVAVVLGLALHNSSADITAAQSSDGSGFDQSALEEACRANAADDDALAACLEVVRSTLAESDDTGSTLSLEEAAAEYLALVEEWNVRNDEPRDAYWSDDGDAAKRAKFWAAWVELEDEYTRGTAAIPFPPEVQPDADAMVAALSDVMIAERRLAGNPFSKSLRAKRNEASDVAGDAGAKLRMVLGLPPLMASATPEPTPEPTPIADVAVEAIPRVKVGKWGTVEDYGGDPELRVKVLKVRQDPFFQTSLGRNVPDDGHVWISALVRYEALQNGVIYGPLDWQVFVGDEAYGDWSAWTGAPEPGLEGGTLPRGRKAKGWVTFSVPKRGGVTMAYEDVGEEGPPFEFVLRNE